jgi:hypothetical protein
MGMLMVLLAAGGLLFLFSRCVLLLLLLLLLLQLPASSALRITSDHMDSLSMGMARHSSCKQQLHVTADAKQLLQLLISRHGSRCVGCGMLAGLCHSAWLSSAWRTVRTV